MCIHIHMIAPLNSTASSRQRAPSRADAPRAPSAQRRAPRRIPTTGRMASRSNTAFRRPSTWPEALPSPTPSLPGASQTSSIPRFHVTPHVRRPSVLEALLAPPVHDADHNQPHGEHPPRDDVRTTRHFRRRRHDPYSLSKQTHFTSLRPNERITFMNRCTIPSSYQHVPHSHPSPSSCPWTTTLPRRSGSAATHHSEHSPDRPCR